MSLLSYTPLLIKGSLITLGTWVLAALFSAVIGFILGIASCRYGGHTTVQRIIRVYTFITKGIPAYVQILIAYFVVPSLLHIKIPGFIAAIGALAICSSGYVTEIVRASINAIPPGQWQASFVLGYPWFATLRYIIIPQAIRISLPALCGELEQLLKSTSLLATIGITELTRTGMNIISRELNPISVYLLVALIYLVFSGLLHIVVSRIEKKYSYGYR